tara:strand:- start:17204 stop:17698 length:495 start_codon:yes stop_codon:yes gene_type:complete
MIINLKKNIIYIDQFKLKCSVGKGGIKKKNKEGDNITPKGLFSIEHLYYRPDRINSFKSRLETKIIRKNMGWCNDSNSNYYNRLIKITKNFRYYYEKLYRKDYKYDLMIPISYNFYKPVKNKGSAIFIHLTKDYKPTEGCIALKKKDFFVMLNLINKNTKIKIY